MRCTRCGAEASGKYCSNCGAEVTEEKEKVEATETNESQEKEINLDEMIDSFIGNNRAEIRKENFSWLAFFFGPIYYFYRKMFIEGLILIAINGIVTGISEYLALPLGLGLSIYMGLTFKKHYLKFARQKCLELRMYGMNNDQDMLNMLASNKGGTTVVPVIIISVVYFVVIVIVIIALGGALFLLYKSDKEYTPNYDYDSTPTKELNYTVPEGFYISDDSTYYKIYETNDKYCTFTISEENTSNDENNNVEALSLMQLMNHKEYINGRIWNIEEETSETNNKITLTREEADKKYSVTFFYIDDEEHQYCKDSYENLKDSLKIEDSY